MDGVVLFRAERKNRTDHSGKLYAFHHIFRVILLSVASHHFRAWVGTIGACSLLLRQGTMFFSRVSQTCGPPGGALKKGPLLGLQIEASHAHSLLLGTERRTK